MQGMWKAAVAAGAIVCAVPAVAQTMTMTQTASWTHYASDNTYNGQVTRFNAVYGVLQSVTIEASTTAGFGALFLFPVNPVPGQPIPPGHIEYTPTGIASLTINGTQVASYGLAGAPVSRDFGFTGLSYLDADASGNTTLTLIGSGLAPFVGSGFAYLDGNAVVSLSGLIITPPGVYALSGGDPSTQTVARVTYTYVAATSVPEPATWATMVVGMFLAGGGLRSARRQAQPAGNASVS